MKYKVGDIVVLSNPLSNWNNRLTLKEYMISLHGEGPYTVTSVTEMFVRINGDESGWFEHTFTYYVPQNKLPEDLFEL